MSERTVLLTDLLTHLKNRELITDGDTVGILQHLTYSTNSGEPLYVRIMTGIGAWSSAMFFILFLFSAHLLREEWAAMIWGMMFLTGALVLSQIRNTTFYNQLGLAGAIAGNCLLVGGAAQFLPYDELSTGIVIHTAVCAILYPFYKNVVYRFLAPAILVILATTWILEKNAYALIHVLIGLEAFIVGMLFLRKQSSSRLKPLAYAAAAMLPATLLFFQAGQRSIWRTDYYEPLWPSNLILTTALVYLYAHLAGRRQRLKQPLFLLAVTATVLLGLLTTPGILVALGLLILGYAYDDRILTGYAYLFLPVFLVLFYYVLNVSLAYKSWVIAGSGVILLLVRSITAYLRPEGAKS